MRDMDQARVVESTGAPRRTGPVLYWMSRDQRSEDNWALSYAAKLALDAGEKLFVAFCMTDRVPGATARHYGFMMRGLQEVGMSLLDKGVCFRYLEGNPPEEVVRLAHGLKAGIIVCDYSPLRHSRRWRSQAEEMSEVRIETVDAHNIVPVTAASDKREYGAYTIRPKLKAKLRDFLNEAPGLKAGAFTLGEDEVAQSRRSIDRIRSRAGQMDPLLPEPGMKAANRSLDGFIYGGLDRYGQANDPNMRAQSGLSPYFHFGQLSPRRAVFAAMSKGGRGADDFIEQAFVRRELSDNFCHYCEGYDSIDAFPEWARKSLEKHRGDARDHLFTVEQMEACSTHDKLWNAAQAEMEIKGSMPGYLRMYWAKKILEWSEDAGTALKAAIQLNDRWSLDGRDPNGYAGIAWSIGGVHDRPWGERPVFGMVRYMSYSGAARKFDVEEYVSNVRKMRKGEEAPHS